MKRISIFLSVFILCAGLFGCSFETNSGEIAATTLPVYEFTAQICQGTDITVTRLITENVSCLHDYTLQAGQMRAIEFADYVVISGAGLEDFMDDVLTSADSIIDASENIPLHHHEQDHAQEAHSHENDPHIWLSPTNAKTMAYNICTGLTAAYPQYELIFNTNLSKLDNEFDSLISYADKQLADLSTRKIITFHDGFSYMANAFDLTIVHAIEEESGSEASAAELIGLIELVNRNQLDEIFIETNGSSAAATIISAETGARIFTLDMAMAGDSYFDSMYRNIDILKEALQ